MAVTCIGAFQRAKQFCEGLEETAEQIGIAQGQMDFVFTDGRVLRVDLQLRGMCQHEQTVIRPSSSVAVYTLADMNRMLTELAIEQTRHCRVRFGTMAVHLGEGSIRRILVTERFNLHREMREFAQAFYR